MQQESIQINQPPKNEQLVTSSNIGQMVAPSVISAIFQDFKFDLHLSQQLGVIYQLAALEEDRDDEEQRFDHLSLQIELPYVQQQVTVVFLSSHLQFI